MCTYSVTLDDTLVKEAEKHLQQGVTFQQWLQREVVFLLQNQPRHHSHQVRHRSRLSDEQLSQLLSAYPVLQDSDFPEISTEDYTTAIRSQRGRIAKGLEKWL